MRDLRSANLDFFENAYPQLALALRHAVTAETVADDSGAICDVIVDGQPLYGGDARRISAQRVRAFIDAPNRCVGAPLGENPMFEEQSALLQHEILRSARQDGIRFFSSPRSAQSHFLICFGIGLGYHIAPLTAASECQVLIVVEPDVEVLAASLLSLIHISEPTRRTKGLVVITESDPERAWLAVREAMRSINPCCIDGFSYFLNDGRACFQHMVAEIRKTAGEKGIVFGNFGTLLDETIMVRNTWRNLQLDGARVLSGDCAAIDDIPVCVIASGPSLDDALPAIRRVRENAVIMTCGTALRPVLNFGICPDLHVDVENVRVCHVIDDVAARHDLDDIPLVAGSAMETVATAPFRSRTFFFRRPHSSFPFFSDNDGQGVYFTEPSVSNGAVAAAYAMGFKSIYLFGVDLGSRLDATKHHSADTYHYDEGAVVFPEDYLFDIEVPGNFGAPCGTTPFLFAAREALMLLARSVPDDCRLYNCSDGARIDGFAPLRPDSLRLPKPGRSRHDAVSALLGAMPRSDPERIKTLWDKEALRTVADDVFSTLEAVVRREFDDRGSRRYLSSLLAAVHYPGLHDERKSVVMVRKMIIGALIKMGIVADHYLARAARPEDLVKCCGAVKSAFLAQLSEIRGAVVDVIESPETVIKDFDRVQAGSKSAGELMDGLYLTMPSRLAPCPCGSGRKYKHCHGKK